MVLQDLGCLVRAVRLAEVVLVDGLGGVVAAKRLEERGGDVRLENQPPADVDTVECVRLIVPSGVSLLELDWECGCDRNETGGQRYQRR